MMDSSRQITRASNSNLARAFVFLPADRRRDMEILYAFCRVVDDLADDDDRPVSERAGELLRWKEALDGPVAGEDALAESVREMAGRRGIGRELLAAIIDGVTMDLAEPVRIRSFPELEVYCWRVASAVGLASIEVFGYRDSRSREYAENLGLALQLTNILRDVGSDFRERNRIYLPADEMERFGVGVSDLSAAQTPPRVRELFAFQAARAKVYFEKAKERLPRADRSAMVSAEMMRRVYRGLLGRIERDGFRVLETRYRVPLGSRIKAILAACCRL